MSRKSLGIVCVACILCAGCRHAKRPVDDAYMMDVQESTGHGGSGIASSKVRIQRGAFTVGQVIFAAPRYVAVRHKLEIIEPAATLPKSLDAVVAFCGSIQCEVLSSNISGTAADAIPSGSVAMRVAPQDLNKLLDFVGKQGKISQHATETEDKTAAVIDVEAKLKNQTEFRDSLRKMLAKPGVSVADLLQIQEKLTEAQAELDREATQRKMLANETEKVYVEIAFHSEFHSTRGAFSSVGEALRDSGSVLGDSLAALITAVAAIIPWLIVIVPGVWVLVRFIRNFRRRRAERKAASLANS